jgi:hypothetical protein
MADEGIRKAPPLLSYNDVRWMLDDHQAKRAGPLRWHTTNVYVAVPGSPTGRSVEVKTLQELWQLGGDEYEWRDIEEVKE